MLVVSPPDVAAKGLAVDEIDITPIVESLGLLPNDQLDELLAELVEHVRNMTLGKHAANAQCRLLLGAKGVGKSTLMLALEHVLARTLPRTVVTVFVDAHEAAKSRQQTPVDVACAAVLEKLGLSLDPPKDPVALQHQLAANGLFAVLLVDDLHKLFKEATDINTQWMKELFAMGNLGPVTAPDTNAAARRLLVVATGSDAHLRALCFEKLPCSYPGIKQQFPLYPTSFDLNSTRYIVRTLQPVLQRDAFKALWRCACPKAKAGLGLSVNDAFMATGGNMCAIGHLASRSWDKLTSHIPAGLGSSVHRNVLAAVARTLQVRLEARWDGRTPWLLVEWLALTSIKQENSSAFQDDTQLSLALYAAADAGLLLFDDGEESKVCFALPLIAQFLLHELAKTPLPLWFTPHLRLCLRFPFSHLGDHAEQILRRCLAEREGLDPGPDGILKLGMPTQNRTTFTLPDGTDLLKGIFKESPDTFGNDVIWVKLNGTELTVNRWQVKLGCGDMSDWQQVVNELVGPEAKFDAAMARQLSRLIMEPHGKPTSFCVNCVLITTRPLSENIQKSITELGVKNALASCNPAEEKPAAQPKDKKPAAAAAAAAKDTAGHVKKEKKTAAAVAFKPVNFTFELKLAEDVRELLGDAVVAWARDTAGLTWAGAEDEGETDDDSEKE